MKSVYLLLPFLPLSLTLQAQQKYTIRGKIEMRSKSGNIYIDRNRTPINSDGSFEISGEVPVSCLGFIHTDSSLADVIWLEAGTYTVDCRESTLPGVKSLVFRTKIIDGSRDAKLLSDFQNRVAFDHMERALTIRYLDSVFQHFPDAGPLSTILREAYYSIGDSVTQKYIGMRPPAMENNGDIKMLEEEIKRNTKIRTEKSFEEFSMTTPDGKTFQLSSLKGKKAVILDFWASECAPCRAFHPKLIELYKKYNSRGLEIVSISIDSRQDAWLDAIAKDRIDPWVNVSELKGFETSLMKDYFLSYIPFHFLLDGDRKIIKMYAGGSPLTEKDIEEVLNKRE